MPENRRSRGDGRPRAFYLRPPVRRAKPECHSPLRLADGRFCDAIKLPTHSEVNTANRVIDDRLAQGVVSTCLASDSLSVLPSNPLRAPPSLPRCPSRRSPRQRVPTIGALETRSASRLHCRPEQISHKIGCGGLPLTIFRRSAGVNGTKKGGDPSLREPNRNSAPSFRSLILVRRNN